MGTNVYFYKKIEDKIKQQIIEDIKTCDDLENICSVVCSYKEDFPEYSRIHIGKRSAGWKFLFAREILKYCEPNKESILNWLSTGVVIDEYNEVIPPEEFWQDYVVDFQDGINSDEYYIKHPEEIRYEKMDEMIGDLRFTSYICDFS